MKSEIKEAIHEYLGKDWANRSLSVEDQVRGVQEILQGNGIEATDKEVLRVLSRRPYVFLLTNGLVVFGLMSIVRRFDLPDWLAAIVVWIFGLGLSFLIIVALGGHFRRFQRSKR